MNLTTPLPTVVVRADFDLSQAYVEAAGIDVEDLDRVLALTKVARAEIRRLEVEVRRHRRALRREARRVRRSLA